MKRPIPQVALELLQETANYHGVSVADITSDYRSQRLLNVRIDIAKKLSERGWSTTRIAAVLERNPTTVGYYLGRIRKKQPGGNGAKHDDV